MKISPATPLRLISNSYLKLRGGRAAETRHPQILINNYRPVASASTPAGQWILRGLDLLSFTEKFVKTTIQINAVALATSVRLLPIYIPPTITNHYWRLVSDTLASLGPTSIKFLQWSTSRRDLFPEAFCHHARRLQTSVPPEPFPFVLLPIASALAAQGHTRIFVDPHALGSGSVAQVHSLLVDPDDVKCGKEKSRTTRTQLRTKLNFHSDRYPVAKSFVETVVKVLRPSIRDRIVADLQVMRKVAVLISKCWSEDQNWLPIVQSVDQFAQMILPQTDLRREAQNLARFRDHFSSIKSRIRLKAAGGRVIIPKVLHKFCTPEIIVETKEYGLSFGSWLRQNASRQDETAMPIEGFVDHYRGGKNLKCFERVNPKAVARLGITLYLQMLLTDNLIHTDMHPGNLLVRLGHRHPLHNGFRLFKQLSGASCRLLTRAKPDLKVFVGDRKLRFPNLISPMIEKLKMKIKRLNRPPIVELVVLDAGLTLSLSRRHRVNFIAMLKAVAFGEGWEAGRLIMERTMRHACDDPDGFCMRVAEIVASHVGPPIRARDLNKLGNRWNLGTLNFGEAMQEIMQCALDYKVELDPAFVGVVLGTSIVEGFGKILDPHLDVLAVARPYLQPVLLDAL